MLRLWKIGLGTIALILPVIVAAQPPGGPSGGDQGWKHGPGGPDHRGRPLGPPPFHGPMEGLGFGADIWNRPEVQERLGLSGEQVEKLQQSRLELETKRIDTHAKTEIARLNLESLLKKKDIDKAAVDRLINELGDLHKENIRGMVQQKIALGEILNATQLEKVEAFLDRARARQDPHQFMENFQGRGDGQGRMREEMQKRRVERTLKGKEKGEKGPKKDRKGDPDTVGFGAPGQGPFGPPPGPGPRGQGGPEGRRGPGRPGLGGPHGPGFGGPPPPPFPPSEFGTPPGGELPPPPETFESDLGESLEEAAEPPQE